MEEIEIPEYPEDEDIQFLNSQVPEIICHPDSVEIGEVLVKCGNVIRAAKIACILVAFNERELSYEEAMKKIDEIKPGLLNRMW